jgi:glyoxylase-like metal-dependent hydrolase (beta-lactamase superfamily II)
MTTHNRSLSVALGLLMLLPASPSLAQAATQTAPRRAIEKITDNVYRANNNNTRTTFLVTSEGIVLLDPMNRGFAEWFKAEAARQFNVPVKYVIYSHHHWDHASGGAVFADTAQFVGHANMLGYLAMPPAGTRLTDIVGEHAVTAALDKNRDGFVDRDEAKDELSDYEFTSFDANKDGRLSGPEVARGALSDVRPPTITYTDQLTINLGGKRVHVQWMGRMNHSSDMSLITFPDDSVLYGCDYVDVGRLAYRDMRYTNGMLPEWLAAIKKTETIAANFKLVTTCHGRLSGTAADLTAYLQYIEELRKEVAAGLARGASLAQLQATIKMEKYSSWVGYNWVPENVLGMYHFLTDKTSASR